MAIAILELKLPDEDSFPVWPLSVEDRALDEIVRLGELMMEDALQLALGADQRAVTQAGIFAALGAALTAADLAIVGTGHTNNAIIWSIGCVAVGSMLAALISSFAARPIDFFARGGSPHKLARFANDLTKLHTELAKDLDRRIRHNEAVLARTARITNYGFWTVIVSFLLAALIFLGFEFSHPSSRALHNTVALPAAEAAGEAVGAAAVGAAEPKKSAHTRAHR